MHSHVHKVAEWGMDKKYNTIVALYGCTGCDETWEKLPKEEVEESTHDHEEYVWGCFACKVGTLQLNTGDAGRADSMPQKKWDKELSDYREARRQGIQPEGTSREKITDALKASEVMGSAFNGETMGKAKKMTKAKAKGIKEIGI